jgi:SynChlorMet cassette protein ScmC
MNMTNSGKNAESGFLLTIGPLRRRLIAEAGLQDWLAGFAHILELKPLAPDAAAKAKDARMFFLKLESLKPGLRFQSFLRSSAAPPGVPRFGWDLLTFFPVFLWTHPQAPDIFCEVFLGERGELNVEAMIRTCFPIYEHAILAGGFPLHAALVTRNGSGVALTASGGTGKSTCARRIAAPWRPLCDDTVLVLPSDAGGYEAYPFATWSDYLWKRSQGTWNAASHVPLKTVFFLKQAPKDAAKSIGQGEAAIYLSRASGEILMPFMRHLGPDRARILRTRAFDSACMLAKSVPAFILDVSLEGEFWAEMERVLG